MGGIGDMVRRPMLFAACGCAAAVIVSYYVGIIWAAAAVSLCAGPALAFSKQERKRRIIALLLVSYTFSLLSFWHSDYVFTKESMELMESPVYGEITDCEKRKTQSDEPYLQMTVRTEQGRVLCKSYKNGFIKGQPAEGCMAEIYGRMKDPPGKRNPGCFDYALHLRSQGVVKTMTCSRITIYPVRPFAQAPLSSIRYRVFLFRESFLERLAAETDHPTAALIRALLFGDKGSLDEEMLEAFRKNGTAHILAVSGLHIGIIYGFILKLWRWRRGKAFLLFNTTFFLLYATAAGFSPSVTRAVVMVLLHIAASIRNKHYDLANAAFLVFFIVMVRNPFMIFNVGFQMSFLAVLTLTMVLPYLNRFYSGLFAASAAVQIGLGPFMLFHFNYIPLLAVIVNVPVVALAGLIVPLSLVCLALSPFRLLAPAAGLLESLCGGLRKLNETTQIDGFTTFQLQSPPLWLLAVYYLGLLLFATEEGRLCLIRAVRRGRYILRMLILITLLSAGFAAFASDGFEDCNITFVDVGQGDCVCIRTERGYYLFDGGGSADYNVGKSVLREYLLKNGISHIDGAFVTHLHTDHYKGICELSQLGMVDRIYVYEANKLKEEQVVEDTGLPREAVCYLKAGDIVSLEGDLRNNDFVNVEILHPKHKTDAEYRQMMEQETDENLMSLVFKVTFAGRNGRTGVLITGDMGEEGEKEMLRDYQTALKLQSHILKVGHHGSKTSTSEGFLSAVRPAIAVIQVGVNNMYGHPAPETLERLADSGAFVFRNDLMGAVGFAIKKGEVKEVRKMIDPCK
ncbi:MAG: DNA internalization-related competence protein ComEC/Rec2 [Clostridiales bacterium]|nr:DNA internalization-related competence protein ComEC/Rec2 [Clostridiales bacterium]